MIRLATGVVSMRPDAVEVWEDVEVKRRLFWYRQVMTGRFPAKFILSRKISTNLSLNKVTEEQLWDEHARLSKKLSDLIGYVAKGSEDAWSLPDVHPNLLELDGQLAARMLEHCNFCEWNCKVNRAIGKIGFCRLDKTTSIGSYF